MTTRTLTGVLLLVLPLAHVHGVGRPDEGWG
jgi:hypothetical protein